MICKPCGMGGELNREGQEKQAIIQHAKCEWKNGGCFCQHATGNRKYVQT